MIKIAIEKIKKYREIILAVFLWLCVWTTYNTDIFRLFSLGFPHNFFDFIHGIRSIFPFVALVIAIVILIKNKKLNRNLFKGPIGLLGLYAVVGIIASVFSTNPLVSLYWGILYLTAIIVLFAIAECPNLLNKISLIINLNLTIAVTISIVLILVFFLSPGAFSFSTFQHFLEGQRPYENLNDIKAGATILGMAGSRPTGLGRYVGLVAIVMLANLWLPKKKQKIIFSILFVIFFLILVFSRARTSIISFIIAALSILFFKIKSKADFIFILGSIILLLFSTNFYQFSRSYLTSENLLQNNDQIVSVDEQNQADNFLTLSGRADNIWPKTWSLFLSSPLIGRGFYADRLFLNGQHAHNSLLHALVQSGIIGIVFFVSAFISSWIILINIFKKFPQNIILIEALGILTFFTLRGITESTAFFGSDYLLLIPVFAYIQHFSIKVQENNMNNNKEKDLAINFAGTKINAMKMSEVLETVSHWIKLEREKIHWIVVTGMHGIVEAHKNPEFKKNISLADLFVPDGISLVWVLKSKGYDIKKRISGADLMEAVFDISEKEGYTHFFYGDSEDTLNKLKNNLKNKYPNIKIVGTYPSHFKPLFSEEDQIVIDKINESHPDILWVARGLPKQEKWIYKYKSKLNVPVVVGVGAAFNFLSGNIKRAPKWIGDFGFEWFWRLLKEPKRMWRRVFLDGPIFIFLVFIDLFKKK